MVRGLWNMSTTTSGGPPTPSPALHAFDEEAPGYAARWGADPLVRMLRARVLAACAEHFEVGTTVLDVGCGPGLDAEVLLGLGYGVVGVDASPAMVARARARGVDARVLDMACLDRLEGVYDGALSDFGAVNCLPSLRPLGEGLAARLRPGAPVILVPMGPRCLAEDLALLARGRRPRRRDGPVRVGRAEVPVRYLSARRVVDELGPAFALESARALGALVPPPDLGGRPGRRARLEPVVAGWPLLRELGDHTLLVLRRR